MFFTSVCPSVCLKPKFGRLKPKFDEDAEGGSAKRTPHILEFNIPHKVGEADPKIKVRPHVLRLRKISLLLIVKDSKNTCV